MGISETDILVVGGGMATAKLLERLAEHRCSRLVTVLGEEPEIGYNRVLLPSLLAGEAVFADLAMSESVASAPTTKLQANTRVLGLDFERQIALCDGDVHYKYQTLVLAVGSKVQELSVPGMQLAGITPLRNLGHVQKLAEQKGPVLVVGGGLLGIEAADALLSRGLDVVLVHRGEHLMNRQLDSESGFRLAEHLRSKGLSIHLRANVSGLFGQRRVRQVVLDNGETLDVSNVILATGSKPDISLAADAGLRCGYGIQVGCDLQTSVANVFAIGECAETPEGVVSLVESVAAQAEALAKTLNDGGTNLVPSRSVGTHLKIADLGVYAVGRTSESRKRDVCVNDPIAGTYRRLFFDRQRLIGAVLLGDTRGARNIAQSIGKPIQPSQRDALAFGY